MMQNSILKYSLSLLFGAVILLSSATVSAQNEKWTVLEFPVEDPLTGVQFLNSDSGFVCAATGIVGRTFDGGDNWQGRSIAPDAYFEDIFFTSMASGVVVGRNGKILRTVDGGYTWTDESYPDTAVWLLDVEFINQRHGIIIGATREEGRQLSSIVLRTEDGGDNWWPVEAPGVGYSEISYEPGGPLYFLGYGMLMRSDDSGKTWDSRLTIEGDPCRCLSMLGNNGIMGGPAGTVAYSRDSGKTWIETVLPQDQLYVACEVVDGSLGYIGGYEGFLHRTMNGGSMWAPVELPVELDILDMEYAGDGKLFIVGSEGTIIRGDLFPADTTQSLSPGGLD